MLRYTRPPICSLYRLILISYSNMSVASATSALVIGSLMLMGEGADEVETVVVSSVAILSLLIFFPFPLTHFLLLNGFGFFQYGFRSLSNRLNCLLLMRSPGKRLRAT